MDTEARLRRLERSNRLLAALVIILTAAFLIGAGSSIPSVVKARRFELVDPYGTTRAVLAQDKNRSVFRLLDRHGKVCMIAETQDGATELDMFGSKGNAHIGIASRDGMGGDFYVADEAGTFRARLFSDAMGTRLNLIDSKEKVRAMVGTDDERSGEGGYLEILDDKAETLARFPAK